MRFCIKKRYHLFANTNNCTIFASSMKKEKLILELTEKEYDLIQAIRNYRKSYIFSGQEIIYHIEKLFTELMDGEV